eukprot:1702343-Amphidinium_carterae.1
MEDEEDAVKDPSNEPLGASFLKVCIIIRSLLLSGSCAELDGNAEFPKQCLLSNVGGCHMQDEKCMEPKRQC